MKRRLNLALVLMVALPALARGQGIGPGFELERSGKYADAATVYFTTVRNDPVNIPALLGLERVLFILNACRAAAHDKRARARSAENVALRSLEVRVYAGLNQQDSLETVVRRWAASVPQSDAPYREWGLALADHRMYDDARRAYLTGRRTLGGEGTLAIELAELELRAGNWEGSAREWARAVTESPDVAPNAATQLADAPSAVRDKIVRVLVASDASMGSRRLAAEVQLSWGQANEAWAALEPTLSNDPETQNVLRRFTDLAAGLTTPEAHRVRGLALSRWSDLLPSPLAERARAEAVRELLEGNDRAAARRVLEAHGDTRGVTQVALLQLMIADGGRSSTSSSGVCPATAARRCRRTPRDLAARARPGADRAWRARARRRSAR
jgi:hypothetical protein